MSHPNNFPKLHNAAWPGVVGKGPDSEPTIDLDTMLDLTAAAEVDGIKFDGVDLFLFAPHVDIDASDDELKQLADKSAPQPGRRHRHRPDLAADRRRLGDGLGRRPQAVHRPGAQGCRIGKRLRELGVRPHGIVRIDSASSPADWAKDPAGNTALIAETFRQACDVAEDFGERLAAEGEICWGGMHSWREMLKTLEASTGPKRSASRPTWPTRCSTRSATTPRKTRSCPPVSTGKTTPNCKTRCAR